MTGSPLVAAAAEGWDAPGSAHRPPRRGGRGRWGALCLIIPAPARRGGKGRPGRAGSPPPDPAVGECDAMDALDHPPAPARRAGWGRPGRDGITARGRSRGRWDDLDAPDHHHQRQPWGNVAPWTRWITLPQAPAAAGEADTLDAPDHHHQHKHPQPLGKRTPWTFRIIPSASTPGKKKQEGTCPPASLVFLIFIFV